MTAYAKNATRILNTTPALKPDIPYPGKCLTFFDEFTATGSENYVIAAVQKCDIIVGGQIVWGHMANSGTVMVGDVLDCDRYMLSTVAGTMSTASSGCGLFNAVAGFQFQHTGACNIFVSINTGGTGASALFRTRVDIIRP